MAKYALFEPLLTQVSGENEFLEKKGPRYALPLMKTQLYAKFQKKKNEQFFLKRVANRWMHRCTDGWTGPILYVLRFTTGDQKELYSFLVLVVLLLMAPRRGYSLITYY